jgi:hypothetical protein
VLGLDTLQTVDSPSDRGGQARDVSGRLADKATKLVLSESEQGRVLTGQHVLDKESCGFELSPSSFAQSQAQLEQQNMRMYSKHT